MTAENAAPKERLIAIALELINRDHPEDLSLREVARRAGLTSGAPAHHFGNRMGLLEACAEVTWRDLGAALAGPDETAGPAEAIRFKAEAYINFALSRPGPYRLLMSRLFADKTRFEGLSAQRARVIKDVVAQIEKATGPSDDPKFATRRGLAMWSLLHGFVTLNFNEALSADLLETLISEICDLAVQAALAPPRQP